MLRIAACQLPLDVSKPVEYNLDLARAAICEAAEMGAKLVVLPELTNTGYAFLDADEARARATTIDGSVIHEWKALAYKFDVTIVAGLAIVHETLLLNVSVIIDPTGLRGWYRKTHLWNNEQDIFTPGDKPPLVITTSFGRLATMVCYDLEFTEWVRFAMLDDAQVLAIPTNWPDGGISADPTPLEAVRVQAAASQNKMVVVAADRCHLERGIKWSSTSVIADSDGVIRAIADQGDDNLRQILIADVEIPTDRLLGPRNDLKSDRKIHLYTGSIRS